MLRQATAIIEVRAPRPGLHIVTPDVERWVGAQKVSTGLLTMFCRHTSASLLIQENAAPDARRDLENYFADLAPESGDYSHKDEGPDDMPAHLRAALTQTQLSVPVCRGHMVLGQWQGLYLFEHRRSPPTREIALHLVGE